MYELIQRKENKSIAFKNGICQDYKSQNLKYIDNSASAKKNMQRIHVIQRNPKYTLESTTTDVYNPKTNNTVKVREGSETEHLGIDKTTAKNGSGTGDKVREVSRALQNLTGIAHRAGHLVNDELGGLGNNGTKGALTYNIAAITQIGNSNHYHQIEKQAKAAVQANQTIDYVTKVTKRGNEKHGAHTATNIAQEFETKWRVSGTTGWPNSKKIPVSAGPTAGTDESTVDDMDMTTSIREAYEDIFNQKFPGWVTAHKTEVTALETEILKHVRATKRDPQKVGNKVSTFVTKNRNAGHNFP